MFMNQNSKHSKKNKQHVQERPETFVPPLSFEQLNALEQARHVRLCQLLEYSVSHYCDDYLRQLAILNVQHQSLAELARMQSDVIGRLKKTATRKVKR